MRPLAALLLGLALGGAATWALRHEFPRVSSAPGGLSSSHSKTSASPPIINHQPLIINNQLLPTDADAALAAYLALPPLADPAPAAELQARLDRLRTLLTLLPPTHLERLLAALATRIGDAEERLRREAFDAWTDLDAPAVARWAFALVPGEAISAGERDRYVLLAALAWAREDFAATHAWIGALGGTDARRGLLTGLLVQLAGSDPEQALALAQNGDEAFVHAARRAVFKAWARRDPAAALRKLGPALLDQPDTPWSVHEALGQWIARDPAAALDWTVAQPVPSGGFYHSALANISWSLAQTPGAIPPFIDQLLRREDVPNRAKVLENIFGAWARNDASSALAWLGNVTDPAQRSDLVTAALGQIVLGRPDDYMALVRQLPPSPAREQQIASRLSTWAQKDPDAVLAWLNQHQAEPELAAASLTVEGTLIASLAGTDPAAALARWQHLPVDARHDETARQFAQNWAQSDPAAATRWFVEQRPGYYLQKVAARWADQDPLGFVAWARELPDYQRDAALQALTNRYQPGNDTVSEPPPRAAHADKLAQIPDRDIRERALQNHLANWLLFDDQAARAWIEADDTLAPETAARLLTTP